MINPMMKASEVKLNVSSTMLICRLQVLLEEDHKLNCSMNLAWNPLNLRDGWENFAYSIKSKHLRYLSIYTF